MFGVPGASGGAFGGPDLTFRAPSRQPKPRTDKWEKGGMTPNVDDDDEEVDILPLSRAPRPVRVVPESATAPFRSSKGAFSGGVRRTAATVDEAEDEKEDFDFEAAFKELENLDEVPIDPEAWKKGVPGTGSGSDEDEEVDFMAGDGAAAAAPGRLDDEAAQRVVAMSKRLEEYHARLKDVTKQYKRKHREVQRLEEELREANDALDKAATMGTDAKPSLNLRFSTAQNKAGVNADDGKKRNELIRQMYNGLEAVDDDEEFQTGGDGQGVFKRFLLRFHRWSSRRMPLQADLRTIEARYGTSVASYFFFFRWVILNYAILAVVSIVFLVLHLVHLGGTQDTVSTRPFPITYSWSSSKWGTIVGYLPRFLMFSSYDPGVDGVASSTYNNGERLALLGFIVSGIVFLFATTISKWVQEDRRKKAIELFEASAGENRFAKLALNAWDHSVVDAKEVEDLKFAIAEQFIVALHEEDLTREKGDRTVKQRVILVGRRILGTLLYLAVQAAGGYAIVMLTTQAAELSTIISSSVSFLSPISGSIVPAAVSLINAALPTIILRITKLEKWDDGGTEIKLGISRLFLAKLFNVLIQVFSFAQLADPFLLRSTSYFGISFASWRASTQQGFSPVMQYSTASNTWSGTPTCRIDGVAQGLFTIVLTEFVMHKLLGVGIPLAKTMVAKWRHKPPPRDEFNVSTSMVSLLYFQQLIMVTFPYFPYSAMFCAAFFFINFKFEKWKLQRYLQKPLKPWSAKDSGSFFIKFYLVSVLVMLFASSYFLLNRTFPKACTKYVTDYVSAFGTREVAFSGLEEQTFWAATASTQSVTNFGRQALQNNGLATTASTTEAATELVSYMSLATNATDTSKTVLFLCTFACGPFVYSTNAYEPLQEFFKNTAGLRVIYSATVDNSFVMLGIALAFFISYLFRNNTLAVFQRIGAEKEEALRTMNGTLQRKVRRLEKQVRLHKDKRL